MTDNGTINIWLVEDDPAYTRHFRQVVGTFGGMTCREIFPDLESLVEHLGDDKTEIPDVLMMDLVLPGLDGFAGIRWCKEHLPLTRLVGYRQVTDAHLLTLASHHGGRLVTFDRGLRTLVPDGRDPDDLLLVLA